MQGSGQRSPEHTGKGSKVKGHQNILVTGVKGHAGVKGQRSPEHTGKGSKVMQGSKVTILKVLQLGQVQGHKKFAYLNEANPTPSKVTSKVSFINYMPLLQMRI